MRQIEVKVLNCSAVNEAEKNMVFAARLTQRGHTIKNMDDMTALYEKAYSAITLQNLSELPHPTIQKFAAITVGVTGASRRFLTQITRHQNEVKFMSASLQYSDYTGHAMFAMPYEIMVAPQPLQKLYLDSCRKGMDSYEQLIAAGIGHDAAGYATPQGLRNALFICATPYQWKHMIGQRICRRNTDETRIVMLKIWQALFKLSPELFAPNTTGAFCQREICKEGRMSCGHSLCAEMTPAQLLLADYPALVGGDAG